MKKHLENYSNQIQAGHSKSVWDFSMNLYFLSILKPSLSVEFGVWRGSTFQILHKFSKKAIGFDIAEFGSGPFKTNYWGEWDNAWDIRKMDTKDITKNDFDGQKINFAHIDASHVFSDVMRDYETVKNNLADDGIICVDDYIFFRDVFNATHQFLCENKEFSIKFRGENQVYITRPEGAKKIDEVINKLDDNTKKVLKIENSYQMNILPADYFTDVDYAIKTQPSIAEHLKNYYKFFYNS